LSSPDGVASSLNWLQKLLRIGELEGEESDVTTVLAADMKENRFELSRSPSS
jgi:hypothetical protein